MSMALRMFYIYKRQSTTPSYLRVERICESNPDNLRSYFSINVCHKSTLGSMIHLTIYMLFSVCMNFIFRICASCCCHLDVLSGTGRFKGKVSVILDLPFIVNEDYQIRINTMKIYIHCPNFHWRWPSFLKALIHLCFKQIFPLFTFWHPFYI